MKMNWLILLLYYVMLREKLRNNSNNSNSRIEINSKTKIERILLKVKVPSIQFYSNQDLCNKMCHRYHL
jgi:hypothetical protein